MKQTRTGIAVIGAGIAGSWLAYRLVRSGASVVLLSAEHYDTPVVSHGAASVFNRRLMESRSLDDLAPVFPDETTTQHPELRRLVDRYLPREFEELAKLVPFRTLETMLVPNHPVPFPRLGAGGEIIALLHRQISALGGRIVSGRVTDLLIEEGECRGIAWTHPAGQEIIRSGAVVIASGGYSGLLPRAHTQNSGSMLGVFAAAGGELTNLEFSQRHALGDLTAGRVLYPPDLEGAHFYRDGERAVWLERAYATIGEERRDLDIFQQYWRYNAHIPHTLERGDTSYSLGPIYGLSMGGIAHTGGASNIRNVYATGEACHDIAADAIIGRPWATYIASSGRLADSLREIPEETVPRAFSVPHRDPETDRTLHSTVRRRLLSFEDHRFSESAVAEFVEWCRRTRGELPEARNSDTALLILAESYALSAVLRRESRGYFYRADFPTPDPALSHLRTVAGYDRTSDTVHVDLVPTAYAASVGPS